VLVTIITVNYSYLGDNPIKQSSWCSFPIEAKCTIITSYI